MTNLRLTGQIFFRDPEAKAKDGSGRRLMMFVGIIAVPDDFPLKGEHQYTVFAGQDAWTLLAESGIDRTREAAGVPMGSLVTHPIWRV